MEPQAGNDDGSMSNEGTSNEATSTVGRPRSDQPGGASVNAEQLGRISGSVHLVGMVTSRAGVATGVAACVAVFLVTLAIAGFPESWQFSFSTTAAAITLVMVFVIQHTQSRQQLATQLKLDELIRTSPRANDLLVHVESADDAELVSIEREQLEHHSTVREETT